MTIDDKSDDWCLEYLRFTRAEIKEIAFVLQIPSVFRYRIRYTPYDALALVLYRLSAPLRLKDLTHTFNRDLGWMSTIFNDVCIHIDRKFHEKLDWDRHFLTPHRLKSYCEHIQANGEPSGGTQLLSTVIHLFSTPSHPEL